MDWMEQGIMSDREGRTKSQGRAERKYNKVRKTFKVLRKKSI